MGEDNSYERVAGTHTETIQYNRAIIVVSLIVTISRLVTHRPTTIHKHFTSKHFEQLPSQAKTRQHSSTTVRLLTRLEHLFEKTRQYPKQMSL